jgi:hypothetical protein
MSKVNRLIIVVLSFVGLLSASIGVVAWLDQRDPLIREQLQKVITSFFTDSAKQDTENIKALASEYAVGKPSSGFIKKARLIGADEYSVSTSKAKSSGKEKQVNSVSKLEFQDRKEYEVRLDELEKQFESVHDGSAQIQLTVSPPFLRDYCTIQFEDGVVTKVTLSQLD